VAATRRRVPRSAERTATAEAGHNCPGITYWAAPITVPTSAIIPARVTGLRHKGDVREQQLGLQDEASDLSAASAVDPPARDSPPARYQ
jgi:hypothetical protein